MFWILRIEGGMRKILRRQKGVRKIMRIQRGLGRIKRILRGVKRIRKKKEQHSVKENMIIVFGVKFCWVELKYLITLFTNQFLVKFYPYF